MTSTKTDGDTAYREEELLEQWLGHPERRDAMDATDHLLSSADAGQAAALETPRTGVLASLHRLLHSVVGGR